MTVATSTPGQAPGGADQRGRLAGITALLLAALLVLLVVLSITVVQLSRQRSAQKERAQVAAVGREVAVAFTTLDYRSLTQDFGNLARLTTPSFRQAYLTQTNQAAELIVKAHGRSTGTVAQLAVANLQGSTASVIVAINDRVVNDQVPKGQTKDFRLTISLQKSGSGWLASQVQQV